MSKYVDRIRGLSNEKLAEISNSLNVWEWHEALGNKPENWDEIPNFMLNTEYKLPTKRDIIREVHGYIESRVSRKEILRHWHLNYLDRTEKEFKIWWIKRWFKKLFRMGIHGARYQKTISQILEGAAEKNQRDWVKKTFGKGD